MTQSTILVAVISQTGEKSEMTLKRFEFLDHFYFLNFNKKGVLNTLEELYNIF